MLALLKKIMMLVKFSIKSFLEGDTCKVIDLVINPQVAANLSKDDNLKQFFCSLV